MDENNKNEEINQSGEQEKEQKTEQPMGSKEEKSDAAQPAEPKIIVDDEDAEFEKDVIKAKKKKTWIVVLVICLALAISLVSTGIWLVIFLNNPPHPQNPSASASAVESSEASIPEESNPGESSLLPDSDAGIHIEDTPHEDTSLPQDSTVPLTSVQVAQKMEKSTVGLVIYQKVDGRDVPYSSGSGIIMSEDGYILTCAHVVLDGDVTGYIEVVYYDRSTARAEVVGVDTQTDLAVIKANSTGLVPAEFGDSNQTVVGQPVYVIGCPNGIDYLGSFTGGYVSAVNREILVGTQKYLLACIQTDAAINPGNSGGPLINEYGQVIGINSAKLVSENIEGMGFAIPSNTAQSVVSSLLESGYVTGRPKIGITFTAISASLAQETGIPQGIRVVGISEDCDVANRNVKLGDIITAIDGIEVNSLNQITSVLNQKKPGDTVTLTICRTEIDGTTTTFDEDVILSEKTPA